MRVGIDRGLVVWNFDECGAPIPEADGITYFQHGLSSLVRWRRDEALLRFANGSEARDVLPVVVISGSHSSRMRLLRTATGHARLFNLGAPRLEDDTLLRIANDAISRIAEGSNRNLPGSADDVRPCSFCDPIASLAQLQSKAAWCQGQLLVGKLDLQICLLSAQRVVCRCSGSSSPGWAGTLAHSCGCFTLRRQTSWTPTRHGSNLFMLVRPLLKPCRL